MESSSNCAADFGFSPIQMSPRARGGSAQELGPLHPWKAAAIGVVRRCSPGQSHSLNSKTLFTLFLNKQHGRITNELVHTFSGRETGFLSSKTTTSPVQRGFQRGQASQNSLLSCGQVHCCQDFPTKVSSSLQQHP